MRMSYLVFLAASCLAGCTGPSDAVRAAEETGLTNVVVESETWVFTHGCSTDDSVKYRVRGVNRNGKDSTVYVCCGAYTHCSVRF